jgi:hypothetical protein
MLKYYVKAGDLLEGLRRDKDGIASFEYIIVSVCIITTAGAAFSSAAGGGVIQNALATGIGNLVAAFTTAIAGA